MPERKYQSKGGNNFKGRGLRVGEQSGVIVGNQPSGKPSGLKIGGFIIKWDYLLILLMALSLAGYLYLKHMIFGVMTLLFLLSLFLRDAMPARSDSKSIKSSAMELGIALIAALSVWFGLGFLLHTSTPIDVVTSCSMVPALDRGDIILLQGGEIRSQEVELTKPVEFRDFIKNECTVRELSSGAIRKELCTTGLRADGKEYAFDKGGDIVVYQPENAYRDLGLVVHRAVMKLKYKGETNYLIKGDNNPAPDVYGITQDFAKEDHMKGKVILRVPILGYLKLFLSLQFDEPENCKYVVDQ